MKGIKSGIVPKIIIAAVIVYIVVSIISLHTQIAAKKAEADALSHKMDILTEENESLQETLLSELTEEQIRQIAREKLGLVSADDEVYYNVSSGK